jgi:hypothetical protein
VTEEKKCVLENWKDQLENNLDQNRLTGLMSAAVE